MIHLVAGQSSWLRSIVLWRGLQPLCSVSDPTAMVCERNMPVGDSPNMSIVCDVSGELLEEEYSEIDSWRKSRQ